MRSFFPGSRVQKRATMAVIGGTLATLGVVGYTQRTSIEHLLTADDGFSGIRITPSASPADAGLDANGSVPGTPTYIAPPINSSPAESSPAPAPSTATAIDPMDAMLTKAKDYVNQNSWKKILQQYAGVHGGVIISISDYHGLDKEAACRLALGRFVEATIGSIADKENPKYQQLTYLVLKKGFDDCKKDINLKYGVVRFGL